MAKITAVFLIIALLVCSTSLVVVDSARTLSSTSPNEKQEKEVKIEEGENCGGLNEDECLMRRTLMAHLDYIYTQSHKH